MQDLDLIGAFWVNYSWPVISVSSKRFCLLEKNRTSSWSRLDRMRFCALPWGRVGQHLLASWEKDKSRPFQTDPLLHSGSWESNTSAASCNFEKWKKTDHLSAHVDNGFFPSFHTTVWRKHPGPISLCLYGWNLFENYLSELTVDLTSISSLQVQLGIIVTGRWDFISRIRRFIEWLWTLHTAPLLPARALPSWMPPSSIVGSIFILISIAETFVAEENSILIYNLW